MAPSHPECNEIDPRQVKQLVSDNYTRIARELLRPLVDFLCAAREACGGDADKHLIMLVVGIRTAEHADIADYTSAQLASGEVPVFPSLGTNIGSIAESIGAPRETVRRKVGELVDAGWIVRHGNELRFTSQAFCQLAPVREAHHRLAVANFDLIARLIREQSQA
jgi:hypothetical protein